MAQNQFGQFSSMNSIQHNFLRDYTPTEQTMAHTMQASESEDTMTPFPKQTPPGMAYVPFQQWEEPYDIDTAFPIGTIYPALDFPFRGGGSYA